MNSQQILEFVKDMHKLLPKFGDGRINYSSSDVAPVVVVFVQYRDEFLLLQRSNKVAAYQGKWNTVAGNLDEITSLEQKARQEIAQELGIAGVYDIKLGRPYKFTDKSINKTWIIQPALAVLLEKPSVILDWEHTAYVWITQRDIAKYDTVPGLLKSLKRVCEEHIEH